LDVIYERVQNKDEDEVKVDLEKSESTIDIPSTDEDRCCEKKKKCKKRKCCAKLFSCFGAMTCIWMFFYMIFVIAISMRVYSNLKQCFHSKDMIFRESFIPVNNINRIQFDVVTGYVHIAWTNSSDIHVKIYDKVRSLHLVDQKTFDSGVTINSSVLLIHSYSPAFDSHTCQHVAIEVLIPYKFADSLSIGGVVKMGYVTIKGSSHSTQYLGNVDVLVEVGHIGIRDVRTNTLALSSELGNIKVVDTLVSSDVKLDVHTGSINTHSLYAKNLHSVNRFGCSHHNDLIADNVKIDTKFGYSSVFQASTLGRELDLTMNTEYGKTLLVVGDSHELNYTLSTSKGNVLLEYEDEVWQCNVQKSQNGVMNGKCLSSLKDKTTIKVGINTKYGQTTLIADNIEKNLHN